MLMTDEMTLQDNTCWHRRALQRFAPRREAMDYFQNWQEF